MITAIAGVSVWSEDYRNILPFYRDLIGLPVSIETEGVVLLGGEEPPNLLIGSHSEVRGRNTDPARHMVGFASDDIHADFQRLRAAGVTVIEEPNLMDDLYIATFADPEGNYVQLFQHVS